MASPNWQAAQKAGREFTALEARGRITFLKDRIRELTADYETPDNRRRVDAAVAEIRELAARSDVRSALGNSLRQEFKHPAGSPAYRRKYPPAPESESSKKGASRG